MSYVFIRVEGKKNRRYREKNDRKHSKKGFRVE